MVILKSCGQAEVFDSSILSVSLNKLVILQRWIAKRFSAVICRVVLFLTLYGFFAVFVFPLKILKLVGYKIDGVVL